MSLIYAYKGMGLSRYITIQDDDDATITPAVDDVLRISIGREGETAKLVVSSATPTINGSSITKGVTNRLRLDGADLSFDPGVYTLFVDLMDSADANEWKIVDRQVFVLEET